MRLFLILLLFLGKSLSELQAAVDDTLLRDPASSSRQASHETRVGAPLEFKGGDDGGGTKSAFSDNKGGKKGDKTDKEWQEENRLSKDKRYFAPRPVATVYYVALFLTVALMVCLVHVLRKMLAEENVRKEQDVKETRSEFLEFKRPSPAKDMPSGGWFQLKFCPPPVRGTMQMWFLPDRQSLYGSLRFSIPRQSVAYAAIMSLMTAFVWLMLYILSRKKILKKEFVTFHGSGQWYVKNDNFWKISVQDLSMINTMLKFVLAFLLMYFVRQRIRFYEQMKIKVFHVQERLELVAFITGAFLSGDDPVRQRARHDVYRWLNVAHFFNHRGLSFHLRQYDEVDLVQSGLLTSDEAAIVKRNLEHFDSETQTIVEESHTATAGFRRASLRRSDIIAAVPREAGSTSETARIPSGRAQSDIELSGMQRSETSAGAREETAEQSGARRTVRIDEEGVEVRDSTRTVGTVSTHEYTSPSFVLPTVRAAQRQNIQHHAVQEQKDLQQAARARDLILWWVELRVQAAVKQKLMDKDKLKKSLGAIWTTRTLMDNLLNESHRRPMFLQTVLMQLFVDFFVALTPFAALGQHYHAHIMTLPWPMIHTFVVAFFYDCVLQIVLVLWDIFGVDLDDLHLDPVLVLSERNIFSNLGRSEATELPGPLAKTWAEVKDMPDEKDKDKGKDKDKDKDKDKKDKDKALSAAIASENFEDFKKKCESIQAEKDKNEDGEKKDKKDKKEKSENDDENKDKKDKKEKKDCEESGEHKEKKENTHKEVDEDSKEKKDKKEKKDAEGSGEHKEKKENKIKEGDAEIKDKKEKKEKKTLGDSDSD